MSGVYIRGIEMPKDCISCRLRLAFRCFDELPTYERHPNCPLIEVPDHGRLIDADALMEQVERDTPLSAVYEKTMRKYLNTAPTIIPAEEAKDND